jgi:hypothetical protein
LAIKVGKKKVSKKSWQKKLAKKVGKKSWQKKLAKKVADPKLQLLLQPARSVPGAWRKNRASLGSKQESCHTHKNAHLHPIKINRKSQLLFVTQAKILW